MVPLLQMSSALFSVRKESWSSRRLRAASATRMSSLSRRFNSRASSNFRRAISQGWVATSSLLARKVQESSGNTGTAPVTFGLHSIPQPSLTKALPSLTARLQPLHRQQQQQQHSRRQQQPRLLQHLRRQQHLRLLQQPRLRQRLQQP